MPRLINPRDLHHLDIVVLKDLVRFGALADYQIERRYADAQLTSTRLPLLVDGRLIVEWKQALQGIAVYWASPFGTILAGCGLRPAKPLEKQLGHDIAVVDLADHLLATEPQADFRTEREVGRVLHAVGPPTRARGTSKTAAHRPDGLLLSGGKRIAIELEHSEKSEERYASICRWFACEVRLDGVRWYVDNPRIIRRLRKVNAHHGFDKDIDVEIEPFPPGVMVRGRVGPWAS